MKPIAIFALLLAAPSLALAQQTDNHVLHAVPVPGKVVIDGKLADWDLSGQIDVYANFRTRNAYSAQVAAMYDRDNLYLAIAWRDPTPMFNMVDSTFDIGSGWRSDCVQLRVNTDMVMHLDCWYSTAAQHAVINIAYGRFTGGQAADDVDKFNALTDALKSGAQEAFLKGEDGKSYTQEMALPWKLITGQAAVVKATGQPYKAPKTYGPGDSFRMGMEFLWGGPDGKTWPIHRYADLLAEGKSSREFFWTAVDSWGTVKLEPTGHLNLPKVEPAGSTAYLQKTVGPVALRYRMPFDGFATIVIEDAQGRRVKNLIGMAPRSKGDQVDYWDGTDEEGKLAPAGKYRWRGLIHQGIDPTYEATYGTPGHPPWDNADGTGAWMSDHAAPIAAASAGNLVVLAAPISEAGWALIGTDLNGKRLWGQRRFQGIRDVAMDEQYVYIALNAGGAWTPAPVASVGRVEAKAGKYAPFDTKPEVQLIVPAATVEEKAEIAGIAVSGDRLALALSGPDVVRLFDKNTMARLGEVKVAGLKDVAADAGGNLYALSGTTVVKIAGDQATPVVTAGLQEPFALAIDQQGRFFVSDRATNQIKVFTPDGKALRSIGTPGGRPLPGKWDPNGLRNPAGIAVDAQGRIWVAEETMFPKRVSVWTPEGQLVTDYLGPTTYGGMGAAADPADKTRVFGNGCEWRLDYDQNQAVPVANLIDDNLVGDLVKREGREYFMTKQGRLYLRQGDALVMVACFGTAPVKEPEKSRDIPPIPLSAPPGAKGNFSYLWTDRNDDGQAEAEEVQTTPNPAINVAYWGGYWLDERFTLYTVTGGYGSQTIGRIPVNGFTAGGVPLWDLSKWQLTLERPQWGAGKLYYAGGGQVIVGSPFAAVADDGTIRWTYQDNRWSDVHGSHNAPIPDRDDLLVGTLSCIGTADTGGPLGRIFAMNSNMGRLYVFTTDGLLVANVFQDCRTAGEPWPNDPKPGAPLGGVTMGGEWFGGYFFKAVKTNEYYLIAGGTSYNLIKLSGFDSLQPLAGGTITYTTANLAAAEKLQQQRVAARSAAQVLTIARLDKTPTLDGRLDKYPKDAWVQWGAGMYNVRGLVGTDGTNLCLAYDVSGDANPMVNGGHDPSQLFITGDSVDLQLGTDPAANPKRTEAAVGDERLLLSVLEGNPVAVLYRYRVNGEKHPQSFGSPWRSYVVDEVRQLTDAQIKLNRRADGYVVEALVPLATLGLDPQPGKEYKLDLGVIFSDATGTNRAARVYWANKATGLVSDVPGEIMPTPNLWGTAKLAP
jgi:hypothetical protein